MTDPLELPIPRDEAAERAVISTCMWSMDAAITAAGLLTAEDFYLPQHRDIWVGVCDLLAENLPADPVLLADRIRTNGARVDAPYLTTIYAVAPPESSIEHHARIVADCATRRELIKAGTRIMQRASNPSTETAEMVAWSADQVRGVRDQRQGVEVLTRPVGQWMRESPDRPEWVIPGLLAKQDRLVLTGGGGLGKSTVLAQMAIAAAAGVHPFDSSRPPCVPMRVTIIDCENPDHRLKTRLWPMLRRVESAGHPVEDRLTLGGKGNPLDLLNAENALSLLRTIEHDKPDLVYIGPVYKLHNDDPDKEVVVKKITGVLDQIRALGCALITEAHHTKASKQGGSLEPSGSNLWTWWPEFGMGLRLDPGSSFVQRRCLLERWRVDRDIADWPVSIQSTQQSSWPWTTAEAAFVEARTA